MSWTIPFSTTYNSNATIFTITSSNRFYVIEGVVTANQLGTLVTSVGSNVDMEIYGRIASGEQSTILMGSNGAPITSNSLLIGSTGQVIGLDVSHPTIQIFGYNNTIQNDGTIIAKGEAVSIVNSTGSTVNNITNNGIVKSGSIAFNVTSYATTTVNLHNNGTITGPAESYDGYFAADNIYNNGTMNGLVSLRGGADVYNGILGHVTSEVVGGSGADRIYGGTEANTFHGNEDADILYGFGGNDLLFGDAGTDTLNGGIGNDTMRGGTDADNVTGGLGADLLYGEAGADRFIFTVVTESTVSVAGQDTIFDFSRAQGDKINLALIDARAGTVPNDSFSFIGLAAFTGVKGQLHYTHTATETYVSGDINGDKVADFMIHLKGNIALIGTDFLL